MATVSFLGKDFTQQPLSGSVVEWPKALDLSSSLYGGVDCIPTTANQMFFTVHVNLSLQGLKAKVFGLSLYRLFIALSRLLNDAAKFLTINLATTYFCDHELGIGGNQR